MARSGNEEALEAARAEILGLAEDFAAAAGPILRTTLERRVEALLATHRDVREGLRGDDGAALEKGIERAIDVGVRTVLDRLADPDIWLSPSTTLGGPGGSEPGWDAAMPEWLITILRRLGRGAPRRPPLAELDEATNRVWVALLNAATPLDAVLKEFGLRPSTSPDPGGGHFGIQPRTAVQLDPTGLLVRLWKRYRPAYERYAALAGERSGPGSTRGG